MRAEVGGGSGEAGRKRLWGDGDGNVEMGWRDGLGRREVVHAKGSAGFESVVLDAFVVKQDSKSPLDDRRAPQYTFDSMCRIFNHPTY
ncbi:hypothetical protein G7Y89_g7817 [Cudoniella acicularis]|uniref:Uncharacterized protein n=1 Tax=Cudoniella acicularis TaxID=354080 RepID=A0A8H4RK84_9HELO|nr:hypothetical protein G7Y89_g7817 [Cudoniella acicularis]